MHWSNRWFLTFLLRTEHIKSAYPWNNLDQCSASATLKSVDFNSQNSPSDMLVRECQELKSTDLNIVDVEK